MDMHWTERSTEDYLFSIGADFVAQLEQKMETEGINQEKLAGLLGVSAGRVSQILNYPGNISLKNIVIYARTLGMKVSIVAYDDSDPENKKGLVNSEIFKICWETSGKPHDFWAFEKSNEAVATTIYTLVDESVFYGVPMNQAVYGAALDYATAATYAVANIKGRANVRGTANTEDGEIKNPEELKAA